MKHDFKPYCQPGVVFIETGSFEGDGIQAALNAGFDRVISIEVTDEYYQKCVERFKGNNQVELYKGDSVKILPNVLAKIDSKIVFWLDAHYSGGTTGNEHQFPLRYELEIIKTHIEQTKKFHTILIDDIRLFKTEWKQEKLEVKDILRFFRNINSGYKAVLTNGYRKEDILIILL